MATVEIRNIGPIENLSIPVPTDGGVVVLKARNGKGKSQALSGVQSLTGGGKLSVRDGELQGQVEGFGAAITVAKSTRKTGELEVESLDGRLNVADLVDPGLKSADAADAKRIKALVTLSGVKADAALFHDLVENPELFEEIVRADTVDTLDLVTMAARVKRDFEAQARKDESQAEHAHGHVKALKESAGEVDTSAEHDADALQADVEQAIEHAATLRNQKEQARKVRLSAGQAKAKLAELGSPMSIGDVEAAVEVAEEVVSQTAEEVRKATEVLERATADSREAKAILEARRKSLADAKRCESLTAELHETIRAAESVEDVDEDDLALASAAVTEAREAAEQGVRIRDALAHLEKAGAHEATAKAHESMAAKFRAAAQGTDEVLSRVVAASCKALRVEAGRLVLDTSRGVTHFAELSEGERWKLALDIAIDAVGDRGLIVVPQVAWESLDIYARKLIAEHVKGTGVVVLTAEATKDEDEDGELHAEVFGAN